jgi:hypothetical protein
LGSLATDPFDDLVRERGQSGLAPPERPQLLDRPGERVKQRAAVDALPEMARDAATAQEGEIVLEVTGEVVRGLATASGKAIRPAGHTPFDALWRGTGSPAGTAGACASAGPRRERCLLQSICISFAGTATRRAADSARSILRTDSRGAGIVRTTMPAIYVTAVTVLAAALLAGCGGRSTSSGGTLDALMKRPGPDVPVITGASDFEPGVVRVPFLVRRSDARPVYRPKARVWLATGRGRKPFARAIARLETIGVRGRWATTSVTRTYVVHLPIPRPGHYWLVAEPTGARIQADGEIDVAAHSFSPAVGAPAPRSDTPTLGAAGGNAASLTTRRPRDLGLLRYSVAASLDAHRPFVVTFASSQFCANPTCAPVVDVVDAVRRRFASSGVRFIHVEVFRDNDPHRGYNRWMQQWGLPSEPWTFLVGSDGRVKAKFEGPISQAELAAAVRNTLL